MKTGIGIDLGGTRIKAAALDLLSGEQIARETAPTFVGEEADDSAGFVDRIRELIGELETEVGETVDCIGIAAPGLASRDGQRIDFMPGRLRALEGLEWAVALDREVRVLNDAHAALMGEVWQGAARGVADAFMLTLGTGVGGAVISGGQLLRGHLGRAGHLGHISLDPFGKPDICGTPGSLEEKVGNYTIGDRSGGRSASTHELLEAMHQGDEDAASVWAESMQALGAGIVSLINVLDPELVLVGGGISRAWDDIEPVLSQYLDAHEWRPGNHRVELRRAKLGEWAGTCGAVSAAMQQTL